MSDYYASKSIGQIVSTAALGAAQPPMSEVADQMNSLDMQVDRIGKAAQLLIERIDPVMARRGNAADGKTEAPDPALCPHADNLRSLVRRLARCAATLEEARQAVEI